MDGDDEWRRMEEDGEEESCRGMTVSSVCVNVLFIHCPYEYAL